MRKLMLLAAMLAMVLAAAAPAFAQQYQYQSQDAVSGDVTNEGSGGIEVSGDGNTFEDVNIAQCTAALNQANTGNQQVQQAVEQFGYFYSYQYADQDATQAIIQDADVEQYCAQAVGDVTAEVVEYDSGESDDSSSSAAAASSSSSSSDESSSEESSSEEELPETGGVSLLALGAGALLVGGGLIARRIVR